MFLSISLKFLLTSLLINVLLSSPFAHARTTHNSTTDTEFISRMEELKNWKCSTPKPRLVYVGDENSRQITPNSKWYPQVAIIHRCEQSLGCCANHPTVTCMPTETQEVSLVFKKINMLTLHQTFERLSFTNHTSCACQ